jgi:hypothetical protein
MDAKELTPAADIFAVAVLLMELWSGKAPFRRRGREEVERAMRAPHPKPSEIDIRLLPLDDVIGSAMSLDPGARPQDADELGRALRRFVGGVDLGDLARHLGDKVRDLRAHPPPTVAESRPVLQRPPSRPTATLAGTKTFALRDEVEALRVSPPSEPNPEVSTRRIESKAPDPATREVETVATQPLETAAPSRSSTARRGALLLGGAAALAVAAFYLGRAATGDARGSATPNLEATAQAAVANDASAPSAIVPSAIAPPSAAVSASATVVAPAERAQLVLLGDGTSVAVDGVARGPCPAHVSVEYGAHSVVCSFPPTGEHKSTSLTLRPGDRATLRADFTGARPSIVALPR